jgi:methionine sulfoxide reductase heme-binding subunit
MKKLIISGIVVTFVFLAIFIAVRDTAAIWYLTRVIGLMAFVVLFVALLLGELRVMHLVKGDFELFRFHTPLMIFALYLILLHFLTAILDNFKWGKSAAFVDYLGFAFSGKYLIFLSIGTLAFYLMLIIAFTSANSSIQFIGYKKWKFLHFFSYLGFAMAYVHSVNLGTDLKEPGISTILNPVFVLMFFIVTALLLARVLKGMSIFDDQSEVWLASVMMIVLVLGGIILLSYQGHVNSNMEALSLKLEQSNDGLQAQYQSIDNLTEDVNQLSMEVAKWQR